MTGGQVAGIIAAIAFLLLVIFIGIFLLKMVRTLSQIEESLSSVTNDVDIISQQTGKVLATSDVLLKDLNGKLNEVDPVFKAAADLGVSISDLNQSTRQMKDKVSSVGKVGMLGKVGTTLFNMKRKNKKRDKK